MLGENLAGLDVKFEDLPDGSFKFTISPPSCAMTTKATVGPWNATSESLPHICSPGEAAAGN